MFSTGEYQYIKDLTLDYYINGYPHYLCITNNPSNYNSNNVYDVICYYSKDKMQLNDYELSMSNNTKKCSFDSNNYSDNNTIDKLVCEDITGSITLDSKEFIYSNVGNYSNIIAEQTSSNLILLSILSVLVITFLVRFVSKILRG